MRRRTARAIQDEVRKALLHARLAAQLVIDAEGPAESVVRDVEAIFDDVLRELREGLGI